MRMVRLLTCVFGIGIGLLAASGSTTQPGKTASARQAGMESISRYVALLKSGTAQQKAVAAYKLGQQHSSAAEAVTPLIELLGDTTAIDPSQYRHATREHRPTLGEEVAVALVHIGRPAIEPLIHVLKTSPSTEARKNAAWALGALHDTGATGDDSSV